MKRTLATIAVVLVILAVSAATGGATSSQRPKAQPLSLVAASDLSRLGFDRATQLCDPDENGYTNCLNRQLTKLYNAFYKLYGCMGVTPVSVYGDPGNGEGYVYDPGAAAQFVAQAMDKNEDPQPGNFYWMVSFDNRSACVETPVT